MQKRLAKVLADVFTNSVSILRKLSHYLTYVLKGFSLLLLWQFSVLNMHSHNLVLFCINCQHHCQSWKLTRTIQLCTTPALSYSSLEFFCSCSILIYLYDWTNFLIPFRRLLFETFTRIFTLLDV